MKMLLVMAALLGFAGSARADYEGRVVGNWLTSATEDRFGDGGAYTAVTIDGRTGLVVRCLQKKLSLAVLEMSNDPKPLAEKDAFTLKFRVDKQPVTESVGMAISPRLIQVITEKTLVRAIRDGRETAVRLESTSGVSSTHVFKTNGATKAFADLAKECALD